MAKLYLLKNIHSLLSESFTTAELRRLCYYEYNFRPIYNQLALDSSKAEIIDRLVEYAEQKLLLDLLLTLAKEHNAARYEAHQPYYRPEENRGDPQLLDIPIVVVAMTCREAHELVTGTAFDDPAVAPLERTRFQEFSQALQQYGLDHLSGYYADNRDSWTPPSHQGRSIKQIVGDMAEQINQHDAQFTRIRPKFISEDFFSADSETRLRTWQANEWGCIILVDSVSLFHPWLHQTLANSEISSKEQVAVQILSPVNFSQIPLNQLIAKKIMERTFTRLNGYLDKWCDFGAGDLHMLQRWLFAILPEIAQRVQHPRLYPTNRDLMRKVMGKKPRGMEPFIY